MRLLNPTKWNLLVVEILAGLFQNFLKYLISWTLIVLLQVFQ